MINWNALEKFIAPGKVVTLVIVVDGKEIGALSFNVDTLAYKEILEAVSKVETTPIRVNIADKPKEEKKSEHKKKNDPKSTSKPEPEPLDDEPEEDDEIDEETEIKADILESQASTKIANAQFQKLSNGLTREQIMAQSDNAEIRANEHSGSKSAEQDGQPDSVNKPIQQESLFKEDW